MYLTKNKKKIICITAPIAMLACFLYLPQLFIEKNPNEYTDALNKSMVQSYKDYITHNSTKDFDGDGLDNGTEIKIGTDPYNPDSDYDGLSDYYEYCNAGNATEFTDTLINNMESTLKSNGRTYKNPFSINNFILWADDIESRTYGTIIESRAGDCNAYVIDNFTGYIQFPDNVFPYKITNDIYEELEYDKDNNIYKIQSGDKIVLLENECTFMYEVTIFGSTKYKKDTLFNSIINRLLPSSGFISCKKISNLDTMYELDGGNILTPIPDLDNSYDYTNAGRFKYNNNTLSDLADVYANIDKNRSIGVSLMDDTGETLGIIYGYDRYGNLYVSDIKTKEPLGKIKIKEHHTKLYTEMNKYEDYYWYSFTGLGYNSYNNARISFYASSL